MKTLKTLVVLRHHSDIGVGVVAGGWEVEGGGISLFFGSP